MYSEPTLGEIVVESVTSAAYDAILHNPKVALIEPDCPVTISDPIESASKTMNLITWGLDRIDQDGIGSSSSGNWDYMRLLLVSCLGSSGTTSDSPAMELG